MLQAHVICYPVLNKHVFLHNILSPLRNIRCKLFANNNTKCPLKVSRANSAMHCMANSLTLCLLGNFTCLNNKDNSADFSLQDYFENFFREYHQNVKQFGGCRI